MKAVCITEPGSVSIAEIDTPQPGDGEVAIDVSHVGLCGSDLTSVRGLNPLVSYPPVPGHEIAGTVAALGSGVDDLSVGARVTVLPYFNCGHVVPAAPAGRMPVSTTRPWGSSAKAP